MTNTSKDDLQAAKAAKAIADEQAAEAADVLPARVATDLQAAAIWSTNNEVTINIGDEA